MPAQGCGAVAEPAALAHPRACGIAPTASAPASSFRNPRSLIAEITGTADDDPWSPDAMVWPLLEVIDASLDEPWCRTLATHLGHFATGRGEKELRQGRRYAVARRLAGLFASYARQRPQLLVDWESAITGDIDSDLHWQPPLWRALVDRVDADPPHVRHAKTLARLQEVTDRPARAAVAVRAHPAAGHRDRAARRAGHPPRPAPVAAAPQRRPVAGARRRPRRRSPAATTPATATSATRCSPPSAAICASCSAACLADAQPTNTFGGGDANIPTHCSAGCSPTSPPTRSGRKAARCAAGDRSVQVHAATARPARSTCCARCCSACSPTTRRWSRATSW